MRTLGLAFTGVGVLILVFTGWRFYSEQLGLVACSVAMVSGAVVLGSARFMSSW